MMGARFGLPIAGLASGFISSTATIAAMGARAAKAKEVIAAAASGAVLSTIATIIQMALVLAITSMATLLSLAVPLICAGMAATVCGTACTVLTLRQKTDAELQGGGRAFSLWTAFVFALTLSIILVACAALQDRFGENGIIFAAAIAGFADTHSAAVSVLRLLRQGESQDLMRSCRFWPGFRRIRSARSCLPPRAADFHLLFAHRPGIDLGCFRCMGWRLLRLNRRLRVRWCRVFNARSVAPCAVRCPSVFTALPRADLRPAFCRSLPTMALALRPQEIPEAAEEVLPDWRAGMRRSEHLGTAAISSRQTACPDHDWFTSSRSGFRLDRGPLLE
jgi:hypothetical protein